MLCEKESYWSDEEVMGGKWVVLPNQRVARLHHVCKGRLVFITPDAKLVCEHGEVSSSICSWLSSEQRARQEGVEPPSRNSVCTCQNTDGLHFTKDMPGPLVSIAPPADTFFGVLAAMNTSAVTVRGHTLRHVPHTAGKAALFVSEKGGVLCCRHGHSLKTLRMMHAAGKQRKFRGGACDCCVQTPPRRCGLMKVGRRSSKSRSPTEAAADTTSSVAALVA